MSRALAAAGALNNFTPLEMASMPVMAEQPELKALSIKNKPNGSNAFIGGGGSAWKPWPKAKFSTPAMAISATITTKA